MQQNQIITNASAATTAQWTDEQLAAASQPAGVCGESQLEDAYRLALATANSRTPRPAIELPGELERLCGENS